MAEETFGRFFKRMRGQRNLGLREFCLENGFDAGNMSKMERGKLPPPQSREKLEEYAEALGLEKGSGDWYEFFDRAASEKGRIPADICDDKELLAKMPVLFRSVRDRHLSRDDVERLIDTVRES